MLKKLYALEEQAGLALYPMSSPRPWKHNQSWRWRTPKEIFSKDGLVRASWFILVIYLLIIAF
jgi:hypothetical protein